MEVPGVGQSHPVTREPGEGSLASFSMAQQAHGISVNQGNVVLAGGNVNIQNYLPIGTGTTISIADALRLVPNLRKIHLDILSKATPGTGVWFLKTKNYILWLDFEGILKILWGTGIPGAGKTVMASIIINDLESRAAAAGGAICIAYVYFRYSDAADLTVRTIFEILVKQTVERHPECAFLAEQTYVRHLHERTQPTDAELFQLLHKFTETIPATFYVLEALDEAPEKLQVELVTKLASLNVRLFITSRPLKSVEGRVPNVCGFPIVAQEGDLDLHIEQEIARSRDLQGLLEEEEPSFKDEIVATVKKNCGGMFLHASLQLDAVSRCTSAQDVTETLQEFPSEIEAVYHQTWQRICGQSPKNILSAKTILIWVLTAARSMTIEELRNTIATAPVTYKFERKRLVPAATILTICCGLITVEEETRLVRLVHYTAKEPLQDLLRETFPTPDSLLALVCMTHLAECGYQTTSMNTEEQLVASLKADPFLSYAHDAWATHTRRSLDVPATIRHATTFISESTAFPTHIHVTGRITFDILSPLHILAVYNLPLRLIPRIEDPNIATRIEKAYPLWLACWHGNENVAQDILYLPNIQVNLRGQDGYSALMVAAGEGQEELVRQLLACTEIEVNLVDPTGWSALMLAASRGCEGVIKLLLTCPTLEVNLFHHDGWTALMMAANQCHEGVASLLLTHPEIDVNSVNANEWTALMLAASQGQQGIVSHLIAHPRIQVNAVNIQKRTALMLAARNGHEGAVAQILVHPEVQINCLDKDGRLALMLAADQGHEGVTQLLLGRPDIQVNLVDQEGCSALLLAAMQGRKDVVSLLITQPDIEVNLVDRKGWSPLMVAAGLGHEDTVSVLLEHPEIDVNLVDNKGWSAPMFAASRKSEAIIERLLRRPEIQINLVDNDGWPLLMYAAKVGLSDIVRLLLARPGIQVNLIDDKGDSALTLAAKGGHRACFDLLFAFPGIRLNGDSAPQGDIGREGPGHEAHEDPTEDSSSESSEPTYYDADEF